MFILDSLIVGGLRFVFDKIATAVDNERDDEGALREELLAAQMRCELGEIEEDEMADIEREILARLREIRVEREGSGTGALGGTAGARVVGVDLSFGPDDDQEER